MIVAPLTALSAGDVAVAGGKAAILGELMLAGFRVPDGFVVTTAAYAVAAERAGADPDDPRTTRERLLATSPPEGVAAAVRGTYRALGGGPVAVRSSATAEDLPGASFAGQQDTFLNVAGDDALIDAVRRCWASLWNERAVVYRTANAVDQRSVRLAVVVQRMIDAAAAGVLFTADPITGRRRRTVIDAHAGLGEAVVSGAVIPDHFDVDPRSGVILQRRLAGERASLGDDELLSLARLGARVEEHFGAPQDIEFALDQGRAIWLVQSRPITTLYPLPANAPDPESDLRVYFSGSVAQGMFEPITPMGRQTFRLVFSSIAAATGHPPRDPLAGPALLVEDPAMRLFVDVTPLLRDPLVRHLPQRVMNVMEARSATIFARLLEDARLGRRHGSRLATLRRLLPAIGHTGMPQFALRALLRPDEGRARLMRAATELAHVDLPPDSDAAARLDAFERLLLTTPGRFFPMLLGSVIAGMGSFFLATRLLRGVARPDEMQTLLRGLPHNPTTEMDLALWALSRKARDDAASARTLAERSPRELAEDYRAGTLPPLLQRELAAFLATYGHRAIGEIDLGLPRWSEDPAHLLGAIANYHRLDAGALAPDAQFDKGAREAEVTMETLLGRVRGPRRWIARALLRRVRSLAGLREMPKFQIVRFLAIGRSLLAPVGAELAARERIAAADDVYFLTLAEARRAVAGEDLRETVAARRATYVRELARKRVPRVLLSDGTEPEAELPAAVTDGVLRGTPASPGVVTGPARVIRSPQGARLEPGEVLVAPSTDPGWTPLFLTAGGLVMEMGGMMSHGAVVAREYGIPAVVGVPDATERISTGLRVTVDGSAGVVSVEG